MQFNNDSIVINGKAISYNEMKNMKTIDFKKFLYEFYLTSYEEGYEKGWDESFKTTPKNI